MAESAKTAWLMVEVAHARPERQELIAVHVEPGATIADAIEASGISERFEDLVVDDDHVGIFGRRQKLDHPVADGDRVEIYRPLIADPKEIRRERARRKGG